MEVKRDRPEFEFRPQTPVAAGACWRKETLFDRHIDALLARAEYLLNHGAFHIKIHFSGNQLTCWWFNDPLRYQVYHGEAVFSDRVLDKCSDAEILGLAITEPEVQEILQSFKHQRLVEDEIYLRSASLNRVNGMIGLSFSCDNIHYLPHRDYPAFLASLSNRTPAD
jgi:hypothetical protein